MIALLKVLWRTWRRQLVADQLEELKHSRMYLIEKSRDEHQMLDEKEQYLLQRLTELT